MPSLQPLSPPSQNSKPLTSSSPSTTLTTDFTSLFQQTITQDKDDKGEDKNESYGGYPKSHFYSKYPNGESMNFGVRDKLGYSLLPSRPNSSCDGWGTRPDLVAVAVASELEMMESGKMVKRRELPSGVKTPRLNLEEVKVVNDIVKEYQRRTGDVIVFETCGDKNRRMIGLIQKLTRTQLKNELQKRSYFYKNLSILEMRYRLAVAYNKETRILRYTEACQNKDFELITAIRKESDFFPTLTQKPKVGPRKCNVTMYDIPRTVFLSILMLESEWLSLPVETLEHGIFVFDCAREWVFPLNGYSQGDGFDSRYMQLSDEFKEMLIFKEDAGLIHWFHPKKSYANLSTFFSKIQDPLHPSNPKANYSPLKLEDLFWWNLGRMDSWKGVKYWGERKAEPRFVRNINSITANFKSAGFEYSAVAELIVQSNPSLDISAWREFEANDREKIREEDVGINRNIDYLLGRIGKTNLKNSYGDSESESDRGDYDDNDDSSPSGSHGNTYVSLPLSLPPIVRSRAENTVLTGLTRDEESSGSMNAAFRNMSTM